MAQARPVAVLFFSTLLASLNKENQLVPRQQSGGRELNNERSTRKEGGKHTHANTHKTCIMKFTCATLPRLSGRYLLDHAGMFLFKLTVKKKKKRQGGGVESNAEVWKNMRGHEIFVMKTGFFQQDRERGREEI